MFEGHYHGWSEAVFNRYHAPLADLPADGFGPAIPGTSGMSDSIADVIVVEWNNLDALERCLAEHGPEVAGRDDGAGHGQRRPELAPRGLSASASAN